MRKPMIRNSVLERVQIIDVEPELEDNMCLADDMDTAQGQEAAQDEIKPVMVDRK